MKNHGHADPPRFSRIIAVESIPDSGLETKLSASEAERGALAAQCGVAAVQSFEAGFLLRKSGAGGVKVSGALQALITQTCVVTLEPFAAEVHAEIDVNFAPPAEPGAVAQRLSAAAGLLDEDAPDPIIEGQIDLGALAAEYLILNLDLYPRKPGAVFDPIPGPAGEREADSPFAVLRRRPQR
jgi:hypothetical protein